MRRFLRIVIHQTVHKLKRPIYVETLTKKLFVKLFIFQQQSL